MPLEMGEETAGDEAAIFALNRAETPFRPEFEGL